MRAPALLLTGLFLMACKGDKGSTGGDSAVDDTGSSADDTGTHGDWTPAPVRAGTYALHVDTVTQNTCGGTLTEGQIIAVNATKEGAFVSLWGFVPLESNPDKDLRGTGERERNTDVDCVLTNQTDVSGVMASETQFTLEINSAVTGAGAECDAAGVTVPCGQKYSGQFEWQPPEDDTGVPAR